jgi:hypothetical protein
VVPERWLVAEALRLAPGRVTEEQLRSEFERLGVVRKEKNVHVLVTTQEVLNEEQRMVALAENGRGRHRPLASEPVPEGKHDLTTEQHKALNHVLRSRDFVTLVEGPSAENESKILTALRKELWESGGPVAGLLPDRVLVVGPLPATSRGVRAQPGYEDAESVSKFMAANDQKSLGRQLCERAAAPDRVVWVREGSMLGTSAMAELFEQCRGNGTRVVVAHDPAQLPSVGRGSCVPVLKEHAGLESAKVADVRRQREEYRGAVQALAAGRKADGCARLFDMGAISLSDREVVADKAAEDYVLTTRLGKKVTLVAPSSAEKGELNEKVREQLKELGELKKEKSFTQLVPAAGSPEDRGRADFYHRGQVVQFHQNVGAMGLPANDSRGFPAGSRWSVLGPDGLGNVAVQRDRSAESGPYPKRPLFDVVIKALPLNKSDRFQVYERDSIEIAVGDLVRITRNGKTFSATEAATREAVGWNGYPHRDLNCGSVCRVKRFSGDGGLVLDNGLLVPKEFGHVEHGYASTPLKATPADRVVLMQTKSSGMAASAEQFYSAVSLGKDSVAVYTDDLHSLWQAAGRSSPRLSAMDLMRENGKDEQSKDRSRRSRAEQARETTSGTEDRGRQQRDKGFDRERT